MFSQNKNLKFQLRRAGRFSSADPYCMWGSQGKETKMQLMDSKELIREYFHISSKGICKCMHKLLFFSTSILSLSCHISQTMKFKSLFCITIYIHIWPSAIKFRLLCKSGVQLAFRTISILLSYISVLSWNLFLFFFFEWQTGNTSN